MDEIRVAVSTPKFDLLMTGFAPGVFYVRTLHSTQLTLEQYYQWRISGWTNMPLSCNKLLGQHAKLKITWQDQPQFYHGFLTSWRLLTQNQDPQYHYEIYLTSPLGKLDWVGRPRVFVEKSVVDIIKILLQEVHLSAYQFTLQKNYPKLTMVSQWRETNWAFFKRLCAQYGLFYDLVQSQDNYCVSIFDNNEGFSTFTNKTLLFSPLSGQIAAKDRVYHFARRCKVLPSGPEQTLHCQRETFTATTDCCGLRLGEVFQLTDYPDKHFCRHYRVIAMNIAGNQTTDSMLESHQQASFTYQAKLVLIPADLLHQNNTVEMQAVTGMLPAFIAKSADQDDLPDIDQYGCYLAAWPWELTAQPPSKRLRCLQPLAGQHFALMPQTEVLTICLHNQFDDQIILGTVSHPEQPTPVNQTNCYYYTIRSYAGNELTFNDQPNRQQILLTTFNGYNYLKLDNSHCRQVITIMSKQGGQEHFSGNNTSYHIQQSQHKTAQQDYITKVYGAQRLQTKKHSIQQQAGNMLEILSQQRIALQSTKGNIRLSGHQTVSCQSQYHQYYIIHQGNLINTTQQNKTVIYTQKACQFVQAQYAFLTVKQKQVTLNIGEGRVNIEACAFHCSANQIKLYGLCSLN